METLEEMATLKGHKGEVNSVCFNNNGKILCSGSNDNKIKLWNMETLKELKEFDIDSIVNSVCFNNAGILLASGSSDGVIIIWDIEV